MKRFVFLGFGILLSFLFSPSAQALFCLGFTHPMEISEVFPNPQGEDSGNEFIEIHNTGNCDADLTGWTLSDGDKTFTFPTGFMIFGNGSYALMKRITQITLENSGTETLTLTDPTGTHAPVTFVRSATTLEGKSCLTSNDNCDHKPSAFLDGDWDGIAPIDAADDRFDLDGDGVKNGVLAENMDDDDDDGIPNILDWDNDADGDGLPNNRTFIHEGDNNPLVPLVAPTIDTPIDIAIVYTPSVTLSGTHDLNSRINLSWDGQVVGFNIPTNILGIPPRIEVGDSLVPNYTDDWEFTFYALHPGINTFQARGVYVGNDSNVLSNIVRVNYISDPNPPVISETTPVDVLTNDNTPDFVLNTDEHGTLKFSGECSGVPDQLVVPGDNNVTFGSSLGDDVYDNCIVTVTDASGNESYPLVLTEFEIDTTGPSADEIRVMVFGGSHEGGIDYVRDGGQVNYTIEFNENVSLTIHTSSSANNLSQVNYEFHSPLIQDTYVAVFEAGPSDNGLVRPVVNFTATDAAGNQTVFTALSPLVGNTVIADNIALPLSSVNIASNNSNPAYAATNDVVTVSFTSQETIENMIVTIAGEPAVVTNTGGNNWTATLMLSGNEPEGPLSFEINYDDFVGNTGPATTGVTDGSSVTYDRTPPMVSSVSVSTDNPYVLDAPKFYAKPGDTMTVRFVSLEKLRVPQGVIHGQNVTFTNPSGDLKTWEGVITFGNSDTEGNATFSVPLYDLAGNNNLTLTTTTDGTVILFDRTAPTLPIVTDDVGPQTIGYKHFQQADYRFSGQNDLNGLGTGSGSGLNIMQVLFENPVNGIQELATLAGNATRFTPGSVPADLSPYFLRMNLTDKAGNETGQSLMFTQRYGVEIFGRITNQDGDPVEGAQIEVVARYGETCDGVNAVCVTSTMVGEGAGYYSLVVAPDQFYNIRVARSNYYDAKIDIEIEQEDVELNAVLNGPNGPRQSQDDLQEILISTLYTTQAPNGVTSYHPVQIKVISLSGEISVTPGGCGFIVSSLSEITQFEVNDPDVQVTDNGDNTYEVCGAGEVLSTGSVDGIESTFEVGNSQVRSFGTSSRFLSGESRIGVVEIPGIGKNVIRASGSQRDEFVGTNHFWTEEESKAFSEKTNQGIEGKTLGYVNRNGYYVFKGYVHGRLPLSAHDDHRIQNEFKYRPYRRRSKKDEVLKAEYFEKKDQHQKNHILGAPEEKEVTRPVGFKKLRAGDEFRPQRARRTYKKHYKNKFERRPMEVLDRAESRMSAKNMDTVRMRIGGRSVPMAAYLEGRNSSRKKKKRGDKKKN